MKLLKQPHFNIRASVFEILGRHETRHTSIAKSSRLHATLTQYTQIDRTLANFAPIFLLAVIGNA